VTKRVGRTQACGTPQARTRLAQARKFLEVAQLASTEELLAQIEPGGSQAAKALLTLIDLKDTAHYGLIHVSRRGSGRHGCVGPCLAGTSCAAVADPSPL